MTTSTAVPAEHQQEYARLLSDFLPCVIQTEDQNEEYLLRATELLQRSDSLTGSERHFVQLLIVLIEQFEEEYYGLPDASTRLAEASLADDWLRPEDDEAWAHLQPTK